MKKRLLSATLGILMAFSLAACGSSSPATTAAQTAANSGTTAAAAVSPDGSAWTPSTVQILVAAKAGGGTDVVARILAQEFSNQTGKNVVVVNQTEGGGAVCFNNLATADDSAATIGCFIASYFTGYLSGTHNTNPMTDAQPACVLQVKEGGAHLAVNAKSPFNTVEDLVAYAKETPGKLKFGIQLGTKSHIQVIEWANAAGIEFEFVESGSDSEKVTGLMGNMYDVSQINGNQVNQYQEAGELRSLAAFTPFDKNDLTALKDVPTLEEAGYPPIKAESHFMLCVSPKVSRETIEEINEVARKAFENPEVLQQLKNAGYVFEPLDVEGSEKLYKDTYDAFDEIMEEVGIKAAGR